MRIHRFYVPIDLEVNGLASLPPEASHHCAHVLRYKEGDPLIIFNGDGFNYSAKITSISKKQCDVLVSTKSLASNESPLHIHLIQGIARGDKMDFILQKAVELGVKEFTPLFSERCNVKLDVKRLDKKITHWQKTIISASEQSGRASIMKLNQPISIDKICTSKSVSYYLEPSASTRIKTENPMTDISIFIGPEGGWSDSDLSLLCKSDVKGVRLGPRVLRTETAGLSAVSVLQSLWGDF